MPLAAGTVIGEYRVQELLGSGGMGEVYAGAHQRTGRRAALKILHTEANSAEQTQRFLSEGRILSSLHHPNIAGFFECLDYSGRPCLVMEYVPGETLYDRMRRTGVLPGRDALKIMLAVADALIYVHNRNIIHRDLKASNIKLTPEGALKLLDFGIAKLKSSEGLTEAGHVIGTVDYMAPEQVRGEVLDARTDIWAAGILLYEMVTGARPFAARSAYDVYKAIVDTGYTPPSKVNSAVSPEVEQIIHRCLRKKPSERYQSTRELFDAIQSVLTGTQRLPYGSERSSDQGAGPGLKAPSLGLKPMHLGIAGGVVALIVVVVVLIRWPGTTIVGPEKGGTTIEIHTLNGVWHAYHDGRYLGPTPAKVSGLPGQDVQLRLTRDGCPDFQKTFRVPQLPRPYTENPPCGGRR